VTALELVQELGHEELLLLRDPVSGLRAVLAIHDTSLGSAVGGVRMQECRSLEAAALLALRLSRSTTYRAALAGLHRGGGAAVILGHPGHDKSRGVLRAFARALDRLDGRLYLGPDMGIDGRDLAVLGRMTKHAGRVRAGGRADAGDLTALGVLESIRAAAARLGAELSGSHVAVQGLGQVGYRLARLLHAEGARLTVTDKDAGRVERVVHELGAEAVSPDAIFDKDALVLSPNAGGGVLNDDTLPRIRARAVIGAASEQLAEPRHADQLHERGVLHGPDCVVNAGGLLGLLVELGEAGDEEVAERVGGIAGRLAEIWERSTEEGRAPQRIAEAMAEGRLLRAREREHGETRGGEDGER
jgi:leucine dehydrogenase